MSDMAMANDVPPPADTGGGGAAGDGPATQDPTAANDNVAVAEGADAAVAANDDRGYEQPGAVDPTQQETTAASDKPGSDPLRNIDRGDLGRQFNPAAAKRGGGGGDGPRIPANDNNPPGDRGGTPGKPGGDLDKLANTPKGDDLEVINRPLRREPKPNP